MGKSFGYNRNERAENYRSTTELIHLLIDNVSRGGNLLLDIGPTADGRIPVIMQERLLQMGEWLRPNGEAIYGTRAWKRSAQWSAGNVPKLEVKEFMADYNITQMVDKPPAGYARVDAFFTSKGDAVYAILPRWPEGEMVIEGVRPSKVTLLETGDVLQHRADGARLRVAMPETVRAKLPFRQAYVLKLM